MHRGEVQVYLMYTGEVQVGCSDIIYVYKGEVQVYFRYIGEVQVYTSYMGGGSGI